MINPGSELGTLPTLSGDGDGGGDGIIFCCSITTLWSNGCTAKGGFEAQSLNFPRGSGIKDPPAGVRFLGPEDHLEKETVTHCNILAWAITWAEKPSELRAMGLQRIRHDFATKP